MYSFPNAEPQRTPVELDTELIDWVDRLTGESPETLPAKRIQAIEEAIRLWCQQQSHKRLQRSADTHRQRHDSDETGWLV